MEKVRKNKLAIFVFLLPAFLLFACIIVLPIFFSGYYSLLDWDGITKGVFVGLDNYVTLFTKPTIGFTKSIWNMLFLAFGAICLQLPFALLLALWLSRGSFNLNPAYFSRKFKEKTNTSFIDYLTAYRISQAALFAKQGFKMYQAAEKVGIPDANYFSKCFKKYQNMTYSEYVKQVNNSSESFPH